jgi:hypothetical protein
MAITVLDRYDMYARDKSNAGIGSGHLGGLLCSCVLYSTST